MYINKKSFQSILMWILALAIIMGIGVGSVHLVVGSVGLVDARKPVINPDSSFQSDKLNNIFTSNYLDDFELAQIAKMEFNTQKGSSYPIIRLTFNNGANDILFDSFDALEDYSFTSIGSLLYTNYKNDMGETKGYPYSQIMKLMQSLEGTTIYNYDGKITVTFKLKNQQALSLPEAKTLLSLYIEIIIVNRARNKSSWASN